jgi:flagellin
LAIADRMNAQIRGINVAIRNANDGISLAQTAEGALATISDVYQRMRELAIQAQNGSNGTGDRANLDTEFQQLAAEVTRIAGQTKFNGTAIIGAGNGAQVFQVGPNNGDFTSNRPGSFSVTGVDFGSDRKRAAQSKSRFIRTYKRPATRA